MCAVCAQSPAQAEVVAPPPARGAVLREPTAAHSDYGQTAGSAVGRLNAWIGVSLPAPRLFSLMDLIDFERLVLYRRKLALGP